MPDTRNILRSVRVLVIEDETDTRDLLGFVLKSHGATPVLASNVSDALELLETERPDVVVADIGMPGYNGYAFIAALRKLQSQTRRTPVIALTAFSTPTDRDTALTSGFDEYLAKPFEPGTLVHVIRRLYDDRHLDAA